jgi:hypothetical protein
VRPPLVSAPALSACLLIPLVLRTRLWVSESLHGIAAGWTSLHSRFLCRVCPTPYRMTPPRSPAHACSTPTSTDPAVDNLDCSLASVSSVLLDSPSETPKPQSQSLPSYRCPLVPSTFGAADLVSDDEVPVPCPHDPSRLCPVPSRTFCSCCGRLACR